MTDGQKNSGASPATAGTLNTVVLDIFAIKLTIKCCLISDVSRRTDELFQLLGEHGSSAKRNRRSKT